MKISFTNREDFLGELEEFARESKSEGHSLPIIRCTVEEEEPVGGCSVVNAVSTFFEEDVVCEMSVPCGFDIKPNDLSGTVAANILIDELKSSLVDSGYTVRAGRFEVD